MQEAKSHFVILNSSEEAFSPGENGKDLTSAIFATEYSGDVNARGVLMELKNYSGSGTASVYGLERVTGTFAGKTGSFVLEHIGIRNNDVLVSTRSIVPDSGTDELKGLSGKANFISQSDEKSEIVFEYEFA